MNKRIVLLSAAAFALIACGGESISEDGGSSRDAGSKTDAGLQDAGSQDAGSQDSGAGADAELPGDAGCVLDCPELPEECYYDGQDCEAGKCGEPVCPDPDIPCGGLFGSVCPTTHYCDYAEPGACGRLDETGFCRPRPTECETECVEVCSCDGNTYCNACLALMAGRDIEHEGPCGGGDHCAAIDAYGIGDCDLSLGWVWNGTECVEITGCSCDGTQCLLVEESEENCKLAYDICTGS